MKKSTLRLGISIFSVCAAGYHICMGDIFAGILWLIVALSQATLLTSQNTSKVK